MTFDFQEGSTAMVAKQICMIKLSLIVSIFLFISCKGDVTESETNTLYSEGDAEAGGFSDAFLASALELTPEVALAQNELCQSKWRVALQGIGKNWNANFAEVVAFCSGALSNAQYKGWNGRIYVNVSKFNRAIDSEIDRVVRGG